MISPVEEETRKSGIDLALWKTLFSYTRPYRRQVRLLALAGVGTAVVDTLFPLVTRSVIDEVVENRGDAELYGHMLAFAGLAVAISFFIWAFIHMAGEIRTHVSHDIRRAGFERLQELSFSYFDRRPVGWLMARMTSDCERLSNILAWGVLDFFWGTTLITCIAVAMLSLDLKLGLVVLAVLPVLAWASAAFRKRILESARKVRKTNSRITASYNEGIMGVRTSKVFVREEENLREFGALTGEMYAASVKNALYSALYLPVVLALGSVATGLAVALGGLGVAATALSVGTLVAFIAYTRHFFEPVQQMAHWFAEMQMAQASAERVLGLIATEPEIRDAPGVETADGDVGEIEFRDVSFRYAKGEPVLDGFNLRVKAGETIALVGATGGGKSTIVGLLCRFYEPTEGEVLLDGVDYRRRGLHWLQSKLGIVLQTPHLFSGTIADNIRYGKLDASDEEIGAAARLVGAHDFVAAMPEAYQSEVGEGGLKLSTGQKQLVSFARAILARPRILVMDEATSSVDTETEQRIQAGLETMLKGRTSFVIAHRLSTIRSADRILVIEKGRIAEEGNHRELLARRGRYFTLHAQLSLRESAP